MDIRPIAPADRAPLAALLDRIENFSPEEVRCALEVIDLALQPNNPDYLVLVAVMNAELVGYVCYGPTPMTEGTFDLRPYVARYGLPTDMTGMRALDVGTWDGFWAFEMERRGAEVVADEPGVPAPGRLDDAATERSRASQAEIEYQALRWLLLNLQAGGDGFGLLLQTRVSY